MSAGTGEIALVVDDEPEVRAYMKAVLQRDGFQALEAEDGVAALELVRLMGYQIHLLVSDVKMPNMDGIELAACVRREFPAIPIVLVSGYSEVFMQSDSVIPKPFPPAALLSAVRNAVAIAQSNLG